MTARRHWNPDAETLSTSALRSLHTTRLRAQLDYLAARSPFYQRKLAAASVRFSDITHLEDLADVPFTEKSELRESQLALPPFGDHLACDADSVRRVYSTSGTTGRPTYIGLTAGDIRTWREAATRAR